MAGRERMADLSIERVATQLERLYREMLTVAERGSERSATLVRDPA